MSFSVIILFPVLPANENHILIKYNYIKIAFEFIGSCLGKKMDIIFLKVRKYNFKVFSVYIFSGLAAFGGLLHEQQSNGPSIFCTGDSSELA